MNALLHSIWIYITHHVGSVEIIGWDIVKILVMLVIGQLIIRVGGRVTGQLLHMHTKIDGRRRSTLQSLFQNMIKYTVYFLLILTILPIVGVHIEALLAGAGVAGIAIAFGAQSLLKDFFNGLFILLEDQYGVGDYVQINGIWGQIRSVGLRITVIKVWTGELVVVPNGQITTVTNYSKENSIAVIDVNVGYKTPSEEAVGIFREVMLQLKADQPQIVGEVNVLGVQSLNDSNYTVRATAECAPYSHFGVVRQAKQMMHKAFLERGVDIPAQKVVYMRDYAEQEHAPV